jgi:predicted PurR-regulated permease PerM
LEDKMEVEKVTSMVMDKFNGILVYASDNFFNILSAITSLAVVLVIVPFILYYLLKDGDNIPNIFAKFLPPRGEYEARKFLSEMNFALSSYFQGQIIVSLIVGLLVYIGYLIIGLDYPLLMAIIAMVTNLIPFAGPFIGLGFALVVGLMQSVNTGLLVCLVVLFVQQIESNFISPQIIGNKLQIHPLTIILLLLFAGKLAGFTGMLLAVPIYAVSKVVLVNTKRIWNIKNSVDKKHKTHPDFEESND